MIIYIITGTDNNIYYIKTGTDAGSWLPQPHILSSPSLSKVPSNQPQPIWPLAYILHNVIIENAPKNVSKTSPPKLPFFAHQQVWNEYLSYFSLGVLTIK